MSKSADHNRRLHVLLPAGAHPPLEHSVLSEATHPSKRVNVSAACEGCRTRKIKCSAQRPICAQCVKRSSVCQYTTLAVETHPQALKRKYQDLLHQRDEEPTHKEFVELLRSMSMQEAMRAVFHIQAGHDVEAVLNFIKAGSLSLQLQTLPGRRLRYDLPYSAQMPADLSASESPYLDSFIYRAAWSETGCNLDDNVFEYQSKYLKPYHAATFVELQLDRTRPSAWTAVSNDDELLKDLLAAYFTREYHLFPVFQKDYFLEDMASGQNDCCSSFLVNIVLAYACYCSTRIPMRFAYWKPQGLAYMFLVEAKRIWELQVVTGCHRSLTSIQALSLINVVYNLCGLDKLGNAYGFQGLALAREIGIFDGNAHVQSQRLRHATDFTAWGVFNMDSLHALQFFRKPFLPYPPKTELPDPMAQALWFGEVWMRYPGDQYATPSQYGHFFRVVSQFRIILSDICNAAFEANSKITASQARMFGKRLVEWYRHLPPVLTPKYIVLPTHFLPHFEYHTVMMSLYQPFRGERCDDDFSFENAVRYAESSLHVLIRLYFKRHSFEATDVYLISILSKLGFMCLEKIDRAPSSHELEDIRPTLALVLQGLASQGQNVNIARAVYKLFKDSVPPAEILMIQRRQNASNNELELDTDDVEGTIQSTWMPSIVNILYDSRSKELSKLVKHTSSATVSKSDTPAS